MLAARAPAVGALPARIRAGQLALVSRPSLARGAAPGRRGSLHVAAAFQSRGPDLPDRVLASLPYLLPLLDTIPMGRFIFMQFPYVARAMQPLGPLFSLYHALPFLPFVVFLGVYAGLVNNQQLSRYIRYNAAQAVMLDILIIIPQVLLDTFGRPTGDGLTTQLYITATNTVFLFVAICTAYGMGACAVGQTPRLPLVADAAESQMRDGGSGF